MRLAYVLSEFPAPSETFIRREMAEVERQGHEIIPCALGRGDFAVASVSPSLAERGLYRSTWCRFKQAALASVGPKRGRERGEGIWAASCALEWAKRLKGRGVDRVHAHFISEPAAVGVVLAARLKVPFSVSAHARDIWVETTPLLDWVMRAADAVAVCTRAGAEALRGKVPATLRTKIVAIHHGLDSRGWALADARPWPRRRDNEPWRLLFLGRLVEKKGVGDLIAAVAALRKRDLEVQLDVVGDGPDRALLERQAAAFGVAEWCAFHGFVEERRARLFLEGTDLLVAPSIVAKDGDRDGIPNGVLEALSAGAPVVAARVGGLAELADDYGVVWPAEPGDCLDLAGKIEQVLTDAALAQRLRATGWDVVREHFDLGQNVARLIELWGTPGAPRAPSS